MQFCQHKLREPLKALIQAASRSNPKSNVKAINQDNPEIAAVKNWLQAMKWMILLA